jgi:hypothetical protein
MTLLSKLLSLNQIDDLPDPGIHLSDGHEKHDAGDRDGDEEGVEDAVRHLRARATVRKTMSRNNITH